MYAEKSKVRLWRNRIEIQYVELTKVEYPGERRHPNWGSEGKL
jgi:hypothetical protein